MVGAVLALTAFYGCQKELNIDKIGDLSVQENFHATIDIDEAKAWYELQAANIPTSSNEDESLIVTNKQLKWDESIKDFNKQGREYLILPVKDAIDNIEGGGAKFLLYKDSQGNFKGNYIIYLADSSYYNQTGGNYNLETFTGAAIYTNLNGKFENGYKIVNGQVAGEATAKRARKKPNSLNVRGCRLQVGSIWIAYALTYGHFEYFAVLICDGGGGSGSYGNGGGGGGTWGTTPSSAITETQFKARLKTLGFSNLERDIILDNTNLKNKVITYFNTRGWEIANAAAIKNNLDFAETDLANYLLFMVNNDDFYEANNQSGFPLINSAQFKTVTRDYFSKNLAAELQVLAANNSNLSGPGFQVFKNLILKVLKKKVPDCIPGLGTLADLTEAYALFQAGNYAGAATNVASAILDLVPPAKLLKLAVNVVDIVLTVNRVAEPIIKLYNHFGTRFGYVFDGFFNTFDNLGIIDKLEISTTGSSVVNIDVTLDSSVTVDDFLNYLSGFLGVWQTYGGGKLRIDLGGGNDLFFYPRSTSGDVPSIQISIDGIKMKLRFK